MSVHLIQKKTQIDNLRNPSCECVRNGLLPTPGRGYDINIAKISPDSLF